MDSGKGQYLGWLNFRYNDTSRTSTKDRCIYCTNVIEEDDGLVVCRNCISIKETTRITNKEMAKLDSNILHAFLYKDIEL